MSRAGLTLYEAHQDRLLWRSMAGVTNLFKREILITLQMLAPMANQDDSRSPLIADAFRRRWNLVADQIDASPPEWRWWLRRHPTATQYSCDHSCRCHRYGRPKGDTYAALTRTCDFEFGRLMHLPNAIVVDMNQVRAPRSLSVMLKHSSVMVTIFSQSAREAAAHKVPTIFLTDNLYQLTNECDQPDRAEETIQARVQADFKDLMNSGSATVVKIENLNRAIARMPPKQNL